MALSDPVGYRLTTPSAYVAGVGAATPAPVDGGTAAPHELRPVNLQNVVVRVQGRLVRLSGTDAVFTQVPVDARASTIVHQSVPERYDISCADEDAMTEAARLRGTSLERGGQEGPTTPSLA